MKYETKCNGNCPERIDTQAWTIQSLRERLVKHVKALRKASKEIVQLKAEKADVTKAMNDLAAEVKTLKAINHEQRLKLHQVHANYTRSDANWDSRPKEWVE